MRQDPAVPPQVPEALPDRIVRVPEAQLITGLCRTSLWHLEQDDPTFPQAVIIASNRKGWHLSALLAWVRSRPTGTPPAPTAALARAAEARAERRQKAKSKSTSPEAA